MAKTTTRALDENELRLVEKSREAGSLPSRELVDLVRQLRQRRERVQRLIRDRNRAARKAGTDNKDTGAREKKVELIAAIERVSKELDSRNPAQQASVATENLKAAVKRKAAAKPKGAPRSRTADEGPAEKPNEKIAPSGALHAEGKRPARARASGR